MDITEDAIELIRLCSTVLPDDVRAAIEKARDSEKKDGMARSILGAILENIQVAEEKNVPICQDTGTPAFWVRYPGEYSQAELEAQLTGAVRAATRAQYLRPNAVDPVTGVNSGDNTGDGVPVFHFHQWNENILQVRLMLKGGGSENVSAQYALPNASLAAPRDLEGVRRCVVDAVYRAQGRGCAPGVVGVGIGGGRETGLETANLALFRKLGEEDSDEGLRDLEADLLQQLNSLGIGPMGLGGGTTVLAVKAKSAHRLPACYFVSVAYICWAVRRRTMIVEGNRVRYD